MKTILLIIFSIMLLFSVQLKAEEEAQKKETFKFGVAILPQYAIANTMRMDFDLTLKNHNVLTISPLFSFARHSSLLFSNNESYYDGYSNYDTNDNPENISLTGGGVKLTLRHFFSDFNRNTGMYFGAGLHYKYSHISYEKKDWISEASSLPLIHYGLETYTKNFNQGGLDFIIGYQMYLLDNIYGDLFVGWGFRLSDFNNDDNEDDYWGETIFDVGYTGYTPLLGLRFGVFF